MDSRRRATSAATMVGLSVILIVMAWWGLHNAFAPVSPSQASSANATCSPAERATKLFAKPSDITVSVYNAGARSGYAALTLQRLEARGFNAGAVGNAPAGAASSPVTTALVLTTSTLDDPYALLVARNLGKNVRVEVTTETLGPGIDVLIGKKMGALAKHAPKRLKLPKPVTSCVKVD